MYCTIFIVTVVVSTPGLGPYLHCHCQQCVVVATPGLVPYMYLHIVTVDWLPVCCNSSVNPRSCAVFIVTVVVSTPGLRLLVTCKNSVWQ